MLHDFIEIAIEAYPDEWNRVFESSNENAHIMQYSSNVIQMINASSVLKNICFHKLTYKNKDKESEYIRMIECFRREGN